MDRGPEDATWKARLRRSAHDVAAKRELWEGAIEARDALVLSAYDDCERISDIADVALVTHARVVQIVAAKARRTLSRRPSPPLS